MFLERINMNLGAAVHISFSEFIYSRKIPMFNKLVYLSGIMFPILFVFGNMNYELLYIKYAILLYSIV